MELRVKTSSERFWWGVYGLVDENGWEDVEVYNKEGILIDTIHLYAKSYLRAGLRFIKNDVEQLDYVEATKNYLKDNRYYYWYYYDQIGNPESYEVEYEAPKNKEGANPKSIEIWIPEERISIANLKSSIQEFAVKFLKLRNCEIKIDQLETIEESIKSYKLSTATETIKINLSSEQIYELSKLWNKSENETFNKLSNWTK